VPIKFVLICFLTGQHGYTHKTFAGPKAIHIHLDQISTTDLVPVVSGRFGDINAAIPASRVEVPHGVMITVLPSYTPASSHWPFRPSSKPIRFVNLTTHSGGI